MATETRKSDLVLPILLISVIGMFIIPLPTMVLDSLLTCNIAFALCLVVGTIYLAEASRFTSLPTILLLATLFRLGLNISTTKQLLGTGHAPDIIRAFGDFVVHGNLAVGFVIFAIITLVQFMVIAKGAERIAEVAARFALDAMPGKQMSIDADVRAGIIGVQEAKELRADLHKESKLYGALDGAMKFVKGDAIAGLIITAVNIIGGLIVGVSQQNLGFAQALEKYTLFTIGDGLVSQIPALLVATAAGIAVTRVQDQENSLLGRELFQQLGAQPQALLVTGVVLIGMGFMPGLPLVIFLVAGMGFSLVALHIKAKNALRAKVPTKETFSPKVYSPVILRLSNKAVENLRCDGSFAHKIPKLRSEIFQTWGLIIPDIHIEIDNKETEISAKLYINGSKRSEINQNAENNVQAIKTSAQTIYFSNEASLSAQVYEAVSGTILSSLADFVDDTQSRMLIEVHMPVVEDLANSVVPEKMSITELTFILRQLVLEEIPVCEFRTVLQAIAEHFVKKEKGIIGNEMLSGSTSGLARESDSRTLLLEVLADVRQAMCRTITERLRKGNEALKVWTLAPSIDYLFAQAVFSSAPIDPAIMEEVVEQVRTIAEQNEDKTLVLCSKYSRILLASLLKSTIDNIEVLAANEISADTPVDVQGCIESSKLCIPETEENETQHQAA